jgi:hypothetical protein
MLWPPPTSRTSEKIQLPLGTLPSGASRNAWEHGFEKGIETSGHQQLDAHLLNHVLPW